MTTPTPSAHSGEQGKPSDRAIAEAFREFVRQPGRDGISGHNGTTMVIERRARELQCEMVARDREADRNRFPDPAFNEWLDVGISDCGHTVWDLIGSVGDAFAGWENRPYYAREFERKHEQSEPVGEVVVTRDGAGAIVAVTRQDSEGRILSTIASAPPPSDQAGIAHIRSDAHSEGCAISDEVVHRFIGIAFRNVELVDERGPRIADVRAALQWYESAFPRGVGSGIFEAYKTWPNDIRAKLSAHDLRRMSGWAPLPNGAWRIDTSAGRPILMYEDCSVIEAEAATYVLSLINRDVAHPAPEAQAEGEPVLYAPSDWEMELRIDGDVVVGRPSEFVVPLYLRPQPSASETPSAKDAWLPIESAPKRGEEIELCRFTEGRFVWIGIGAWCPSRGKHRPSGWREPSDEDRASYWDRPTHWRALTPPIAAQRKEGES